MKAQFIYEKFTDESDPIKDMSIGGFMPFKYYEKYSRAISKAENEYKKYLNQFVGKTISGNMRKYNHNSGNFEPFSGEVLVDTIHPSAVEKLIRIVSKNPPEYYNLDVHEKYIIK